MSLPIFLRYALRSLLRNKRRLWLSLTGIGIGVAVGLVCLACLRGEQAMVLRAVAESGPGHLKVVPRGFMVDHDDDRRLPVSWRALLDKVRQLPGVRVATPRARVEVLLAMGTRTSNVEMVGVDPLTEPRALRLVRHVSRGRYLRAADRGATVLGAALAEHLRVDVGDELVATLVGEDGNIASSLLSVVGIVSTGSREIDLGVCHVVLGDIARAGGIPGAGDITVLLDDAHQLDIARSQIAALTSRGEETVTYRQVAADLLAGTQVDAIFFRIMVGVVLAVVLLGVASAQLAAILERRRECAVLNALGMKASDMARAQLVEAAGLSVGGTFAALGLALPVVGYLATTGVDMAALGGGEGVSGVLLDPVFRADLGFWMVPYALILSATATLVASLYPAWFAVRVDPAESLRVAQ